MVDNHGGVRAVNQQNVIDKYKNESHFVASHLNIRSMNTGFDEFVNYLNDYGFDVLGLSETWLTSDYDNSMFSIPGYNFIRKDRAARGGGVGIYVKKYIKFKIIELDIVSNECEFISISFSIDNKNILFASIYRPPTSNIDSFVDWLEDIFGLTVPFYDYVIFTGDLNIDLFKHSAHKTKLEKLFDIFGVNQVIKDPTRINPSTNSSSLIDIIITNTSLDIKDSCSLHISETISDHNLVYAVFNLPKRNNSSKYIKFRDYRNINFDNFEYDALQLQWDQIYYTQDVNDKLNIFNNNILFLINKHAPMKQKKVKERPFTPWITNNIKLLMKLRDKAYKKYLKQKTETKLQYYRELRNFTKHAIIREKIAYFKLLSQKNGKDFWSNANKLNLTRNKDCDIPEQFSDATILNNYFASCNNTADTTSEPKINFYKSNRHRNITSELNFELVDEIILNKILNT